MTQQQRDLVHTLLRDAPFDLGGVATVQRPLLEQLLTAHPLPGDVHVTRAELGGVPVALATLGGSAGVLFHLHGGGFAVGSAQGSLGLATALARRTGLSVVSSTTGSPRSTRSPRPPTTSSRRTRPWSSARAGPDRIVVSGESAGGNLAVGLLVSCPASRPAAPVVSGPAVADDRPHRVRRELCRQGGPRPQHHRRRPSAPGSPTTSTAPTRADPRVSPIFADLTGLPPLLIQVGSHEVLLDDATRLAVRAAAADVDVTLDVTPGVPHVFQAFAGVLDEGAAALDRAGAFVRAHLSTAREAAAS